MNCSKCKARMEDGFIPNSRLGPEFWVAGPNPSFAREFIAYKK